MATSRYRQVKAPLHPKATTNGFISEHVFVAERALGKLLPEGAQVHHVNHNKRDNRPSNLVVCQDAAYHALLHQRERALRACGRPDYLKCCFCKQYDNPAALKSKQSGRTGRTNYHNSCAAEYVASRKRRVRQSQQPWLYEGAA